MVKFYYLNLDILYKQEGGCVKEIFGKILRGIKLIEEIRVRHNFLFFPLKFNKKYAIF